VRSVVGDVHRIEACYAESAFVREICVLDESAGSDAAPYAVVVPDMDVMRTRRIVNIGDLLRFELEGRSIHLPPHERLSGYEIWFDPLPRTPSGRVDRTAVAALIEAKRQRRAGNEGRAAEYAAGAGLAGAIAALIAMRGHGGRIEPASNLEIDLGFDSMARVELIGDLEARLGVRLDQENAAAWLTVGELVSAFQSAGATMCAAASADPWPLLLGDLATAGRDIHHILDDRPLTVGFLYAGMRVTRSLLTGISVTGRENLPRRGPYIIAPNHQSYLDPFFVCSVLPYGVVRQMFVLGASEYFETPLMSWIARQFSLVAVDPDARLVEAMRAAAFGLTHGRVLMVFPEGERSIDGTVKRFKKGATILSRHLQVPIVPVGIDGAFDVWPRNRPFNWRGLLPWRRHHVRIAIGEPIRPDPAQPDDVAAQQLRDTVDALWQTLERSP
jgi:long-chain acyl-CoA synthetase